MKREQFTFYRSYYEALKSLPQKDIAKVVMAICSYALDEEPPSLSGVPLSVFTLIRPTLDSGRKKAENRQNKTKTKQEQTKNKTEQKRKEDEGEKEVESESEGEKEKDTSLSIPPLLSEERPPLHEKSKRFVPPSVEDVAEYCRDRGNSIDPERFVDFYASKGWRIGNTPMKDWKAAVRTWEKRDSGGGGQPVSKSYSEIAAEMAAEMEARQS